METMTKYTKKALNDTAQGMALLNSEVKMLRHHPKSDGPGYF
jgi:hypothetical protein